MARLFFLIYSIVGATCTGIGVVIALTIGQDTLQPILVSAAAGAVVGLGASWLITKALVSG